MKFYFLGTCSGTEPMLGRNHVSFAIEQKGELYIFDAGENCARSAHLLGLDLLKVKKIVISHTHMDHIGGLAPLLWHIRKLSNVKKINPIYGDVEVYIPNLETFDGVMKILKNTEGNFATEYKINEHLVVDGVVFDDGMVKVTAFHNGHLPKDQDKNEWRSFSYLIESEGKKVVYSGDVFDYTDLDVLIGDYVDALIVETGHHKIETVYQYTKDKNIGKIYFNHHGREIINFPEQSNQKVQELFDGKAEILVDNSIVEL
ncbi:MAG: ribonuclease Z [Clostridia bacterium]|nr:ribonuclease Z [Clostridia bacterium]